MSDQADTNMGGASPERQHAELANDASNITMTTQPEERASKRLKMDHSEPTQSESVIVEQGVPGEGLHDAPVGKENAKPTNENHDKEGGLAEKPVQKPGHVDGRSGTALIKKE